MITKKNILILPAILFFLIILVFFYLLLIERNPSEIPSNLINKNVPNFETDTLLTDNKFISPNEFKKEITLVNFFATWCKPCRDEHLYIEKFSEEENIRIIGVNYKDNPDKTKRWLKEMGNPYSKIAIDKDGSIAIDWGVYGIPETFVVNSDGLIKYRHVGPISKITYKKIKSIVDGKK